MELDALDDRALVARTQDGNRDAFCALVERYQERVLNLVYRRLNDRDLAYDVAQEVFFKAYRALARFKGDSAFYTWLFRITINETISARRKQMRHDRTGSLDQTNSDGEKLSEPADTTFDPEAEAERLDDQALVQRAIAGLDEDLAQVILLRDIDGRSYQEISAVLQIPLGSVKSRIHRGRQHLKESLSKVIERSQVSRPR